MTTSMLSKFCAVHYKNAFVTRLQCVLLARSASRVTASLTTLAVVHTLDPARTPVSRSRVQRVGPHQNAICQNKSHGKIVVHDVVISAIQSPISILACVGQLYRPIVQTSSSAVAERPRDTMCLSVVSFNSAIRRAQSSINSRTSA